MITYMSMSDHTYIIGSITYSESDSLRFVLPKDSDKPLLQLRCQPTAYNTLSFKTDLHESISQCTI